MSEGIRPSREAAEKAVEQFLDRVLPDCSHSPRLIEDGDDSWAFWIEDDDTTSYVHHDLTIEWYGTDGVKASGHQVNDRKATDD